jgi:hypothetical protein
MDRLLLASNEPRAAVMDPQSGHYAVATQRRTILDWHGEQVGGGGMTSEPIRDPHRDHLLTPANSALVIIDYQPVQVGSIRSMDRDTLVANIVRVARTASLYRLPIVLTTVNVKTGANQRRSTGCARCCQESKRLTARR